jgi:glycosyltransferase involved in cell wall biosynthesis
MLSVQPLLFDARIQKEARALADAGWDVHVWHVDDAEVRRGVGTDSPSHAAFREALRGITVTSVNLRSREWRRLPALLHKGLQAIELAARGVAHVLRCRASVYECHDLTPALFAMLGWLMGAKVVYDSHEVEVRSPNRLHRAWQALSERALVAVSSKVITVNSEIAKLLERKYSRPVHVVMNRPAFRDALDLDTGLLRRTTPCPAGARILVYVGYVIPGRRGIEHVVDSLAYLPDDVQFVIVGVGRLEAFQRHIGSYIAEHRLDVAGRVTFQPPVAPDAISDYLSGADLSVMLYDRDVSKDLATPNKLFQSIMARVPMLGTDTPMLRAYICDNDVGPLGDVADPADAREVAARILHLLDPAVQREIRGNADRMAVSVSWQPEAERLVSIFAPLRIPQQT